MSKQSRQRRAVIDTPDMHDDDWRPAPLPCPHCGAGNEMHMHAKPGVPAIPHRGDYTMCMYCGNWGVFGDDMTLRKPTADEAAEIATNPACKRAQFALVLARMKRAIKN